MNKILGLLSIILVLGIIVAVGFFGYNKYQEVELEKKKLQSQKSENKEKESNDQHKEDATNTESSNVNNNNDSTVTRQQTSDGSEKVEVSAGGAHKIENKENFSHLRVNRDNVFDYVIAAVNQSEGGDASLIKFQQPVFIAQGDGIWKIAANNKSGAGAYTFIVEQDGSVQIWNGPMNLKIDEKKINLN